MLTNPFTGVTINEWTEEARKASAEARRRRRYQQSTSILKKAREEESALSPYDSKGNRLPFSFSEAYFKKQKRLGKAIRIEAKARKRIGG